MRMQDSSPGNVDAFCGIEWRNVRAFMQILLRSTLRLRQSVLQRYREQGTSIAQTVAFLKAIHILEESEDRFSLTQDFEESGESNDERIMQSKVIDRLLQTHTRFRQDIHNYLRRFKVIGAEVIYHPDNCTRGRESSVRNFLMELGVVEYCPEADRYRISRDRLHVYIDARDRCPGMSPMALRSSNKARETFGLAAEEIVLSHERERVGKTLQHLVDHVSIRNVAAGYDIRSVTLVGHGSPLPRYIEVKAVSDSWPTFYWTANEIKVAALLAEDYYLYLLPVTRQGQFHRQGLQMIQNAHEAILGPNSRWQIREDVICCSLKGESVDCL